MFFRYVAEHDVAPIEMKWEDAHKIYEIYRPEKLPEFDGRYYYKSRNKYVKLHFNHLKHKIFSGYLL